MIGRVIAVVVHQVAEWFAPVDVRAKSFLTMGGADRLSEAEERDEVFEPWHASGPTEWQAPPPAADDLRRCGGEPRDPEECAPASFSSGLSGRVSDGSPIGVSCSGPSTRTQAHESSTGCREVPADVAPSPVSPPNQAPDSGHSKHARPRVVSVLGPAERDAVWQCQELAPTRVWDAAYRWNPRHGWWDYNKSSRGWAQSSAGHRDVSALTINPIKAQGLIVEFVEILDHPDLLGAEEGPEVLIDDVAEVLCVAFTSALLTALGDKSSPAEEFWVEGLDESGRDMFRGYACALLREFEVSRK